MKPKTHLAKIPRKDHSGTKTIEEAQKYAASSGTFRESKRPSRFTNYVALINDLSKSEPTNISDALKHEVLKDAMSKEYQSIVKNDV